MLINLQLPGMGRQMRRGPAEGRPGADRAARPRRRRLVDSPGAACFNPAGFRGVNSAVECHLHTVEVVGSNPTRPTNSPSHRAASSAGRAPRSQRGGRGFESLAVHHPPVLERQASPVRLTRRVTLAARGGRPPDRCARQAASIELFGGGSRLARRLLCTWSLTPFPLPVRPSEEGRFFCLSVVCADFRGPEAPCLRPDRSAEKCCALQQSGA